jgi:hypothetical protein
MSPKYKTFAIAQANLIESPTLPAGDLKQSVGSALEGRYGFELDSQVDLLYVSSCLVTTGINSNDDIFLPDELWTARKTPVLKPFNWQHESTDILGVMYGVAARNLKGEVIDLEGTTPQEAYELYSEAAIYKLIQPARAIEITERAKANSLFVSMEAWFDDYDFGLIKGGHVQIVKRTEATAWLDKHLRANGGDGNYDKYRVGRVLRNFTFGGCGFVDVPANKRSLIFEVLNLIPQESVSEDAVVSLFKKVEPIINQWDHEEKLMATEASVKDDATSIAKAILSEQAELAKAEALKKEQEALVAKASQLETERDALSEQVTSVKDELAAKDAEITALAEKIKAGHASLDGVMSALGEVPPEIAKIDRATDGESAFKAMISWITQSVATLVEKAKKVDELEGQIAVAAAAVRENEIRDLLKDRGLNDEAVQAYVTAGLGQDDESYGEWFNQIKLLAMHIQMPTAKAEEVVAPVAAVEPAKDAASTVEPEAKPAVFAELVAALDVKSKVKPGQLREPKDRLVKGSVLDNVKPVASPNLSGTEGGASGESRNPMAVFAHEIYSELVHKGSEEKKA